MASQAHRDRLAQGPAAVYSLAQAARLLPMDDRQARDWLVRHGLVRELEGRRVVIWGEVLEELQRQAPRRTPPRRRKARWTLPVAEDL